MTVHPVRRTVAVMPRISYTALLRSVPAFRNCRPRALAQIASLVDTTEVPAGTVVSSNHREVVVTLTPTRVLVIERRALDAVTELAPGLVEDQRTVRSVTEPEPVAGSLTAVSSDSRPLTRKVIVSPRVHRGTASGPATARM